MNKIKTVIILSVFLLLAGILSSIRIVVRFIPVLGGDSVGPNILFLLSNFSIYDYLQIALGLIFFISGLVILLFGIIKWSMMKSR